MKGGRKKTVHRKREYIGFIRTGPFFLLILFAAAAVLYFALPLMLQRSYMPLPQEAAVGESALVTPAVVHLSTPEPVRAIYMTSCAVGSRSFREELLTLVEETELNSVVIDIKDYTGGLSFVPEDETLKSFVSPRCIARDMRAFIERLHEKGVYVIGRITVFQDPLLANLRPDLAVKRKSDGGTWKDFKGLSFTDPGAREVWDHHILIAKESYAIGFDELNFDYIRFPSDGPMQDIAFSWSGNKKKSDVLEEFFSYLSAALKPADPSINSGQVPVLSADLFGMTTTNTDDLNIGQVLEKAAPYFDYLSPMVYPSHYPAKFNGYQNPNHYPYEVVKYSMDSAVKRLLATTTRVALLGVLPISTSTRPVLYPKPVFSSGKLRPWLQDFDYGGTYDVAEVQAQIQATYDAGLTSWMLWSPSNRYTKKALVSELDVLPRSEPNQ
ncbi:MAG: putative glycoside hydrolase [bacterium]|nr:putative glycoside hydrolase [bacterium]